MAMVKAKKKTVTACDIIARAHVIGACVPDRDTHDGATLYAHAQVLYNAIESYKDSSEWYNREKATFTEFVRDALDKLNTVYIPTINGNCVQISKRDGKKSVDAPSESAVMTAIAYLIAHPGEIPLSVYEHAGAAVNTRSTGQPSIAYSTYSNNVETEDDE